MQAQIEAILNEIKHFSFDSPETVEQFRLKYLSRKGVIPQMFDAFKQLPPDEKRALGKPINELKRLAEDILNDAKKSSVAANASKEDFTRPLHTLDLGSRHPLTLIRDEIVDIFTRIGFDVSTGPEIEDDWHNFSALNFPEEHPARDMQDTFFVEKNPDFALRTHTSSVQVRVMENQKPPIRTISPGRVFRNEAISARSHCFFHQIEGLYIDKDVSFADMKQTILYFAEQFFGKSKIRMRPSYFPFTEPSAEVDVYWGLKNEVDYRLTKGTGWLEIMGCGMVDPAVLTACGIDPEVYSGFAFGMGIERIALNRFQIPDIRIFSENDNRFLMQFAGL
ncbi:MAG: phenylalanine--tRNA ligase subunit alpha [Flavobacteriales bacterium]|nr:MAG: phenylalanine--tRNA ligase subunit alpha [Flavobacteriales bacterium]